MDTQVTSTAPFRGVKPIRTGTFPDMRDSHSRLAVVFVFLSLVALAGLPLWTGQVVRDIEAEIRTVLSPARDEASELAVQHARQMAALQSYLLTGESRYRARYADALEADDRATDRLLELSNRLDIEVRQRALRVFTLSRSWRQNHSDLMALQVTPETFLERGWPEEQQLYDAVLQASRELQSAIDQEVARGEARMDRARSYQLWGTLLLVALALLATLVLALLAGRLRRLVSEAERRRNDALRARREADAVLAATDDGVLGVDRDADCTFVNRAGADILGRTVVSLQAATAAEALAALEDPARSRLLEALRAGEEEGPLEGWLVRPSGERVALRLSTRPQYDGRERVGAVLSFVDITDQLAARALLQRAVKTREELMAVLSHDLRNPIGTVFSAAELLLEVPLSEEKRRQHLEAIRRTAERMEHLVKQLLDVARIEGDGLGLRRSEEEVGALLEEAVSWVRERARSEGIEIAVRTELGSEIFSLDRDRTVQALTNLLGNAIKFSEPGGQVVLEARSVPGGIEFTVEDRGEGIEPELREHLFDRYWQAERSGRAGAGLGLAIVKGIVDAHGGKIAVESESGEGSLFRITLPEVSGGRASDKAGPRESTA